MSESGLFSMFIFQMVNHPFHIFLEATFAAVLLFALFRRGRRGRAKAASAPEMPPLEEQERRIAAFQSQLFLADSTVTSNVTQPSSCGMPQVEARSGCRITVRFGSESSESVVHDCLDLATEDFHSFSTHPDVLATARSAVCAYGVGSCGPRGFYGTIKPHLDVEKDLATFLSVEDAIVYSFSFTTISTLISCYAGRGEYLIVDEDVNISVMDGCILSRATLVKYRHNDMAHLETILRDVAAAERAARKLSRRFVVTEGVFKNTGDVCDLPRVLELCEAHKFRLMLEDSYGFGCLGPSARGTPEHFGIPTRRVDVYVASLSASLGGVGGFCAGEHAMVDFQRLAATAYVFSASLPPYVTAAASTALALLDGDHTYAAKLHANTKAFRQAIRDAGLNAKKIAMVECVDDASPIVVIRPTEAYRAERADSVEEELERVVKAAREKGVLLLRHLFSEDEQSLNIPGLRVLIKGKATGEEMQEACKVIIDALRSVFS